MIKVIYQKQNGDIFSRIRNTYFPYRVGDTTAIGWKVLDIQYRYKDKYYNKMMYDDLINKSFKNEKALFRLKKNFILLYKYVNHILLFMILLKAFEIIIKKGI